MHLRSKVAGRIWKASRRIGRPVWYIAVVMFMMTMMVMFLMMAVISVVMMALKMMMIIFIIDDDEMMMMMPCYNDKDARLTEAVDRFGNNWTAVAEYVGGNVKEHR